METKPTLEFTTIPCKREIDMVDVGKTLLRVLGGELVPGLRAWISIWNEHDTLELERRQILFWEAFIHEAKTNDSRFKELSKDVESNRKNIDMLTRILTNLRAEYSELKQKLYGRVAVNAIITPDVAISFDEKLSAIEALDRLTNSDLELLHRFKGGCTWQVKDLIPPDGPFEEESLGSIIVSIRKLEARGLINNTSGKTTFTLSAPKGSQDSWANQWKYSYYELLPFGKKVMLLIEQK